MLFRSDDANIYVTSEASGLTNQDINVSYKDEILTISGERKTASINETAQALRKERSVGPFERKFAVGEVDFDSAKAKIENGLLKIVLPKAENQKPKQLKIK